jgi:hypothetical protein
MNRHELENQALAEQINRGVRNEVQGAFIVITQDTL